MAKIFYCPGFSQLKLRSMLEFSGNQHGPWDNSITLWDQERSSTIWKHLGVETSLLWSERSRLIWFELHPTVRRPRSRPRTCWRDFIFTVGSGTSGDPPGGAGIYGWRWRSLDWRQVETWLEIKRCIKSMMMFYRLMKSAGVVDSAFTFILSLYMIYTPEDIWGVSEIRPLGFFFRIFLEHSTLLPRPVLLALNDCRFSPSVFFFLPGFFLIFSDLDFLMYGFPLYWLLVEVQRPGFNL